MLPLRWLWHWHAARRALQLLQCCQCFNQDAGVVLVSVCCHMC